MRERSCVIYVTRERVGRVGSNLELDLELLPYSNGAMSLNQDDPHPRNV